MVNYEFNVVPYDASENLIYLIVHLKNIEIWN